MIQRVWYVEDDVWPDPLETTIKVKQPFWRICLTDVKRALTSTK